MVPALRWGGINQKYLKATRKVKHETIWKNMKEYERILVEFFMFLFILVSLCFIMFHPCSRTVSGSYGVTRMEPVNLARCGSIHLLWRRRKPMVLSAPQGQIKALRSCRHAEAMLNWRMLLYIYDILWSCMTCRSHLQNMLNLYRSWMFGYVWQSNRRESQTDFLMLETSRESVPRPLVQANQLHWCPGKLMPIACHLSSNSD